MVICKSTTHAYYPMPGKGPGLIHGSGRIRYVRGFILVNRKEPGAAISSLGRPEKSKL